MEICKHSQNIIFAPQNIEIDTVVFLTLTNNAQQLIKTTQLHLRFVFVFLFVNSICIIWFLLRSLLYLFNTINCHFLCINGYCNNIWVVYFSAILDNCSMPSNIVQEIVNDYNSRTIPFLINHKNLDFHIVFLLFFGETFSDIGVNLVHIYTHTLTLPHTNILTLHTDIYSFHLFHFQFEVVKSKKGWNTGNKSYCYGSVSYHMLWIITHKM